MKIIECPRDAMQGISQFIPTNKKIEYINQLLKVGFDTIDFGSFVSPKIIPQLRDTAKVLDGLDLCSTSSKLLAIIAKEWQETKKLKKNSVVATILSNIGLEDYLGNQSIELHIASYNTADKANAHWFSLQQVNQDLLVNYNHRVVKVSTSEEDLYRLRILGFASLAAAQDMCSRLIERGEKCVPSIDTK